MTSEGLNFCIWKGETLRYFLCATLLLLKFFLQNKLLSPVLFCSVLTAWLVLCKRAVIPSALSCALRSLSAFETRIVSNIFLYDHSLSVIAKA